MNKFLYRWCPPLYMVSVWARMVYFLQIIDEDEKAKDIIGEHFNWGEPVWPKRPKRKKKSNEL